MTPNKQVKQRLESLQAAGVEFLRHTTAVPVLDIPDETVMHTALPSEVTAVIPGVTTLALEVLAKEIAGCKKCPELFSTRTQTVFGVGPISPDLCFIGEAPGADEDAKGEPFVGRAGQKLNQIIETMKMTRSEVYICNTLKCRPPNNATPTPIQCENCRPFFERQIDLIKPKFICCLGSVAAKNVLASELTIGRLRGKVHAYRGIPVVCTYHPSYLLRNPAANVEVWEDMKLLLRTMGRPIPDLKKKA